MRQSPATKARITRGIEEAYRDYMNWAAHSISVARSGTGRRDVWRVSQGRYFAANRCLAAGRMPLKPRFCAELSVTAVNVLSGT